MKKSEAHTHCKRISDVTLMKLRMQGSKFKCFYEVTGSDEPFPCELCGYKIDNEKTHDLQS